MKKSHAILIPMAGFGPIFMVIGLRGNVSSGLNLLFYIAALVGAIFMSIGFSLLFKEIASLRKLIDEKNAKG